MKPTKKVGLAGVAGLYVLCLFGLGGCADPLVNQGVHNCQPPQQPVQVGIYDVYVPEKPDATTPSYITRLSLTNRLNQSFQHFKAKIWYEYPPDFSRLSLGSQFLQTQDSPGNIEIPASGIVSSGQTVTLTFSAVSPTVANAWKQANELSASALTNLESTYQSGPSFMVTMHVELVGVTKDGVETAVRPFAFPIRVCKGCLHPQAKNMPPSSLCLSKNLQDPSASSCGYQDGFCNNATEGSTP
ncbi:MAG: hypothetical protein EP343_25100 [Deltaproteobacteria bacterium]|nr:MAG: hypothetical protein EP343_25100 [Deltaproteobacteria bacterium]